MLYPPCAHLGCDHWFPPPQLFNSSEPSRTEASLKPVQLFNIESDPEERHEVSQHHPEVVHFLLDRLQYYANAAKPINYPDDDPKCDPGPGGTWGPWAQSEFNCRRADYSPFVFKVAISGRNQVKLDECKPLFYMIVFNTVTSFYALQK